MTRGNLTRATMIVVLLSTAPAWAGMVVDPPSTENNAEGAFGPTGGVVVALAGSVTHDGVSWSVTTDDPVVIPPLGPPFTVAIDGVFYTVMLGSPICTHEHASPCSQKFFIGVSEIGSPERQAPTPEPSTWLLLVTGAAGMAWVARKRIAQHR